MSFASADVIQGYLSLVLICLALFLLWFVTTIGTRYWQRSGVPYVEGLPLVGNFRDALLMRKSMFDVMDELYGNERVRGSALFGISKLITPTIVLCDPGLIKQILIKDAAFFCNRTMCTDPHGDPFGYYNLLMIKNPEWRQLRSYLTPSLSLSKIKQMYQLVDQQLEVGDTLLFVVLLCLAYFGWRRHNYWNDAGVPYVPEIPVIGNFSTIFLQRHSSFEYMEHLYRHPRTRNSDFFGVNIFTRPALVLRSPELIKRLTCTDAAYFTNRQMCTDRLHDSIGYYNLMMIKEPMWKELRGLLSPSVTSAKLRRMRTLIEQVGSEMVAALDALPQIRPQVRETEFKELSARYTTDVIASTFFGMRANCLQDADSEFRHYGRKIFEYGPVRGMTMASFFFMPELVPYLRLKLFPADTELFLRTIIEREIARREGSGQSRGDFIDSMIALKNNNATLTGVTEKIPLKGDVLVAQAATFYMASFETTSSVLSFALYELTKHPIIQERLREEVRCIVAKYGPNVPYEALNNEMPYLGMVISETARLYPVLPFLERQCSLPDGATGYKLEPFHEFVVPNKMPVLIPIYAIHRDPKYFPNPHQFDPKRFAKENLHQIQPCTYMPFGVGPRTCLGSHFGTLQIKIALVKLLAQYRIERSVSTPETLTYRKNAFTLHSNEGLYAELHEDRLVQEHVQ